MWTIWTFVLCCCTVLALQVKINYYNHHNLKKWTTFLRDSRFIMFTDLAWLLPVRAVGDIKEDFQYLYDTLRSFQRDGRCCRLQHTLILFLPLDLQAALQGCCEDGHPTLLEKWENKCDVSHIMTTGLICWTQQLCHKCDRATCWSWELSSGRSAVMRNMRRSS